MPERLRESLAARWVIGGRLVLQTALHLGGDGIGLALQRDGRTGQPLLPGTSLAGALRGALADRRARGTTLFGAARADQGTPPGPLIVYDAYGQLPPGQEAQWRGGRPLSSRTGAGDEDQRYDFEVWPPGTVFPLRLDLLVSARETGGDSRWPSERELLRDLVLALETLAPGGPGLGARRSRGLGQVETTWTARRFDLASAPGWLEWLTADAQRPWTVEPRASLRDALREAAPGIAGSLPSVADERRRILFELDLELASELSWSEPPALPGPSLAGALRAQATRIAELFHGPSAATARVDGLFGSTRRRPGESASGDQAARLRVGEARIEGSSPRRRVRLAIDRFTQAAVGGPVVDETTAGGRLRLSLELRDPREGELGLVLLVLKDLLQGRLPVGGGSGVGRGFLRGHATITICDGPGTAPRQAILQPDRPPEGQAAEIAAADIIDQAIRDFRQARKEERLRGSAAGGAASGSPDRRTPSAEGARTDQP